MKSRAEIKEYNRLRMIEWRAQNHTHYNEYQKKYKRVMRGGLKYPERIAAEKSPLSKTELIQEKINKYDELVLKRKIIDKKIETIEQELLSLDK